MADELDLGKNKIAHVADPTADGYAVTKRYLDTSRVVGGIKLNLQNMRIKLSSAKFTQVNSNRL